MDRASLAPMDPNHHSKGIWDAPGEANTEQPRAWSLRLLSSHVRREELRFPMEEQHSPRRALRSAGNGEKREKRQSFRFFAAPTLRAGEGIAGKGEGKGGKAGKDAPSSSVISPGRKGRKDTIRISGLKPRLKLREQSQGFNNHVGIWCLEGGGQEALPGIGITQPESVRCKPIPSTQIQPKGGQTPPTCLSRSPKNKAENQDQEKKGEKPWISVGIFSFPMGRPEFPPSPQLNGGEEPGAAPKDEVLMLASPVPHGNGLGAADAAQFQPGYPEVTYPAPR